MCVCMHACMCVYVCVCVCHKHSVWDMDLDMMCRCTLTGHKDDVTHLSSLTLRRPYPTAASTQLPLSRQGSANLPQSSSQLVLPCTVVASASADGTVRLW